jgi:hypothetical protein
MGKHLLIVGGEDRHDPSVMGVRCLHPALQVGKIVLNLAVVCLRRWNEPVFEVG